MKCIGGLEREDKKLGVGHACAGQSGVRSLVRGIAWLQCMFYRLYAFWGVYLSALPSLKWRLVLMNALVSLIVIRLFNSFPPSKPRPSK